MHTDTRGGGEFLARLRYRALFLIAAGLFVADLFVPDAVPFVDEILLGIATIVLAGLRQPAAETGKLDRPR